MVTPHGHPGSADGGSAHDEPTDVLSFSQLESLTEGEETLPTFAPEGPLPLGDIVISVESAERQARERNHSLVVEMQFLAVHGALHLLGWDHATSSQRRAMWKWQDEVIEKLKTDT